MDRELRKKKKLKWSTLMSFLLTWKLTSSSSSSWLSTLTFIFFDWWNNFSRKNKYSTRTDQKNIFLAFFFLLWKKNRSNSVKIPFIVRKKIANDIYIEEVLFFFVSSLDSNLVVPRKRYLFVSYWSGYILGLHSNLSHSINSVPVCVCMHWLRMQTS